MKQKNMSPNKQKLIIQLTHMRRPAFNSFEEDGTDTVAICEAPSTPKKSLVERVKEKSRRFSMLGRATFEQLFTQTLATTTFKTKDKRKKQVLKNNDLVHILCI